MKNELKFNSQICTTYKQSQRLLEMGLNPETADMVYEYEGTYPYDCNLRILEDGDYISSNIITEGIPAWSLHRLIEMLDIYMEYSPYTGINNIGSGSLYDDLINLVEGRIIKKLFDKEYLK